MAQAYRLSSFFHSLSIIKIFQTKRVDRFLDWRIYMNGFHYHFYHWTPKITWPNIPEWHLISKHLLSRLIWYMRPLGSWSSFVLEAVWFLGLLFGPENVQCRHFEHYLPVGKNSTYCNDWMGECLICKKRQSILIKHESCVCVCPRFPKTPKDPGSWNFGSRPNSAQLKARRSPIFEILIFKGGPHMVQC